MKPVVVKCVSLSNERLNMLVFQLNTLNARNNAGVKNIAYLDADNEIYLNRLTRHKLPYASHRNIQRMAMRQLDYNPAAFDKLLALMAYGL